MSETKQPPALKQGYLALSKAYEIGVDLKISGNQLLQFWQRADVVKRRQAIVQRQFKRWRKYVLETAAWRDLVPAHLAGLLKQTPPSVLFDSKQFKSWDLGGDDSPSATTTAYDGVLAPLLDVIRAIEVLPPKPADHGEVASPSVAAQRLGVVVYEDGHVEYDGKALELEAKRVRILRRLLECVGVVSYDVLTDVCWLEEDKADVDFLNKAEADKVHKRLSSHVRAIGKVLRAAGADHIRITNYPKLGYMLDSA